MRMVNAVVNAPPVNAPPVKAVVNAPPVNAPGECSADCRALLRFVILLNYYNIKNIISGLDP